MKKVIITGATGFIGQNLLEELYGSGLEVIAVVRANSHNINKLEKYDIKIIECNLENIEKLPEKILCRNVDTLYHLAWQGVSDSDLENEKTQLKNVEATLKLIDVAKRMEIGTFIGAGSIHENEVYKEMSQDSVVSNMTNMYKAAKIAAHYMGKSKAGSLGIRFIWPIITNTYGTGERSGRLINSTIRKILLGDSPALSKGTQLYDFIHVKDLARAMKLLGEKGIDGKNYVIGSGRPKQLKEYLDVLGNIANKYRQSENRVELGYGKFEGCVCYLKKEEFDISNLVSDTGFEPLIDFEEGIQGTVKWILNDLNCKKREKN